MYMSSLGSDNGRGLWLQYYGMRAAPTITGTLNSGSLASWYIGANSAGLNTNAGDTTSIRYLISYTASAEL